MYGIKFSCRFLYGRRRGNMQLLIIQQFHGRYVPCMWYMKEFSLGDWLRQWWLDTLKLMITILLGSNMWQLRNSKGLLLILCRLILSASFWGLSYTCMVLFIFVGALSYNDINDIMLKDIYYVTIPSLKAILLIKPKWCKWCSWD